MLTLFVRVTSMYAGEGMDNHYFTEVHDIYVTLIPQHYYKIFFLST